MKDGKDSSRRDFLRLVTAGAAVAGNGLLYFIGRIFESLDPRFLQRQHHHAARLSHSQGGRDILLKE